MKPSLLPMRPVLPPLTDPSLHPLKPMASKSKEQLENELTEALALVEKLTAENAALKAAAAASSSAPDAPLTADEKAIRERVRAGLTRQQAEHAHKAQKEHNAAMKGASKAAAK